MRKGSWWRCGFLRRCWCVKWTVVVVACVAGVVVLWPWEAELIIEKMNVKRVKVHPIPPVGADVWIALSVRVKNRGVYWMELTDVDVGVKYRGKKMGHVESEGWHVRGWGSTHVDGVLEFNGLPSSEVMHLLQDLAIGKVYFHTVIKIYGQLGFLLFRLPHLFKATIDIYPYKNVLMGVSF